MRLAHRWRDRNLSRIEMVIVVVMFIVLIGVFSRYVLTVFAEAERNMINITVMNINTALKYKASIAVMKRNYDELESIVNMNPMDIMQARTETASINNDVYSVSSALVESTLMMPENYGGNVYSNDPNFMEKGKWYYQPLERLLVYRLRNDEFFNSSYGDSDRLRFETALIYQDRNGNRQYDENVDVYESIKLKAVDKYSSNIRQTDSE